MFKIGKEISFTIYGEPVAQGRPRAGRTRSCHTILYDPKKSRDFKNYVRLVASQHKPDKLIDCEIEMIADIYRSIPKSMPKYKREKAQNGLLRPITKPDIDNYIKSIKDGLSGIIWADDKQVVSMTVRKWYSENPRVEVKIIPIGGDE